MAGPSRSTLLNQIHKALKKKYRAEKPDTNRLVLEHVLFGLLLENASYSEAEKAFKAILDVYYDWNEVRVCAVNELAKLFGRLPAPRSAATHVCELLQCVFESRYSFDLESLRKENLGKAIKQMRSWTGSSPFMVSYVVQSALGGHSIPIDRGALGVLAVLGVISPAEQASRSVPGMERTIPKSKGIEFGSLLHHLAAEFVASPYSPNLHTLLLKINPECKSRLPKRPKKPAAKARPQTKKSPKKSPPRPTAAKAKAKTSKTKPVARKPVAKPLARKGSRSNTASTKKSKSPSRGISKRKPR